MKFYQLVSILLLINFQVNSLILTKKRLNTSSPTNIQQNQESNSPKHPERKLGLEMDLSNPIQAMMQFDNQDFNPYEFKKKEKETLVNVGHLVFSNCSLDICTQNTV